MKQKNLKLAFKNALIWEKNMLTNKGKKETALITLMRNITECMKMTGLKYLMSASQSYYVQLMN